jgi:hypothetical protein
VPIAEAVQDVYDTALLLDVLGAPGERTFEDVDQMFRYGHTCRQMLEQVRDDYAAMADEDQERGHPSDVARYRRVADRAGRVLDALGTPR